MRRGGHLCRGRGDRLLWPDRPGRPGTAGSAGPAGACAGNASDSTNQLRPRHPADPLEQLLSVPRAGRAAARDQLPFRYAKTARLSTTASSSAEMPLRACSSSASPIRIRKERMPPPDSGHALTDSQIELLRRWIDEGAKWSSHWALGAPKRPSRQP